MADRQSTASPGGGELGAALADMAHKLVALEREVEQLKRNTGSPALDLLWLPDGGTLRLKRISTGNSVLVAGPV